MFKTLLIANRGEIACRIIRTAHQLGIPTVAVFTDIDQTARHVNMATTRFQLDWQAPDPLAYLSIPAIMAAAQHTGADAIHPGYGFLSENADFAAACEKNNIQFIGPSAEVIASMGDKSIAKQMAHAAGLPVIPDFYCADQSITAFEKAADTIGYPVLVKAIAGGGGKGMRKVTEPSTLRDAIHSAQQEANLSFGRKDIFLEKYLPHARHIEVQVVADQHGNVVHLFDRDCSLQRRHQKIIEEAPAPNLSTTLRHAIHHAAITLTEATGYQNAGTVEFLVDRNEQFYFMEMNTRLQVEHPVTECITGIDLVAWQLRIAAGEPLPCEQSNITCTGHAIEARICSENPEQAFLPSSGTIRFLRFSEHPALRIDTALCQGDHITTHYDAMIAKLIVHQPDRTLALQQLTSSLTDTCFLGIRHNLLFLTSLCAHPAVQSGNVSTDLIDNNIVAPPKAADHTPSRIEVIAAALGHFHHNNLHPINVATPSQPWVSQDGWQLNGAPRFHITFYGGGTPYSVTWDGHNTLSLNGEQQLIQAHWVDPHRLVIQTPTSHHALLVIPEATDIHVFHQAQHVIFQRHATAQDTDDTSSKARSVRSPMPGHIANIHVKQHQSVSKGDVLIRIEAMKMEHCLVAPTSGNVVNIHCDLGDRVDEGSVLIDIEPPQN